MDGYTDNRVCVSDIIEVINAELKRTRMQPKSMDTALRKRVGVAYRVDYLAAVVGGKTDYIPLEVWENIQNAWQSLPDAPNTTGSEAVWRKDDLITLSESMRTDLEAELLRTGVAYNALVRMCPKHLRVYCAQKIGSWLDGRIKNVHEETWGLVLSNLRAISDKVAPSGVTKAVDGDIPTQLRCEPKTRPIRRSDGLLPLRPEDVEAIKRHRKRTGVPYSTALKTIEDCPSGLHREMVFSWVSRGGVHKANPEYVGLVIDAYEAFPDR